MIPSPTFTGGHPAYPGDWFVVDYYAEQVGDCRVEFYGHDLPGLATDPYVAPVIGPRAAPADAFLHGTFPRGISTAIRWSISGTLPGSPRTGGPPADPNASSEAAFDLNADSRIDRSDLASFSEYWLERTDCNEPPADRRDHRRQALSPIGVGTCSTTR